MTRVLRRLALPLLALVAFPAGVAQAGRPQLQLAWHAPYGMPGARDTLTMAAGDSTKTDTLYMSLDPGHHDSTFVGINATLLIRSADHDSLNSWWRYLPPLQVRIGPRNPHVEFNDSGDWGAPSPWATAGIGQAAWDCSRQNGRLRFVYAVGPQSGAAIDSGNTYVVARAIFHHPPKGIANSGQPLCIEWQLASLAYNNLLPEEETHWGEHRMVSINSPGGQICKEFVLQTQGRAPAPWKPKN
jgi:hypothetical protein